GQPLEERRPDFSPLANQHERLGVLQAISQSVGVLDVVGEDLDIMPVQLCERWQRAQRVEVVVEDRDLHTCFSSEPFSDQFLLITSLARKAYTGDRLFALDALSDLGRNPRDASTASGLTRLVSVC